MPCELSRVALALIQRCRSLPHHFWNIACSVQNGYDFQRPLDLAVDNQIRADGPEQHVAFSKVGADMSHPRQPGQFLKRIEELVLELVGGAHVVE